MHLKYRTKFDCPLQEDYDFPIPNLTYSSQRDRNYRIPTVPQPISFLPIVEVFQPSTSTSSVDLSKVPDDLKAYIPDHPIYKDDLYNRLTEKQKAQRQPLKMGSKAWKDHVRQLKHLKDYELLTKQQDIETRETAQL
ncbi:hypothetical protein C1646_758418 [Rhizophagus diaphanus]|nr:hypothetical protein C1646_758418 [Rhizophagus diaphanus] [Rhizophagus sp. MUCL 43196]